MKRLLIALKEEEYISLNDFMLIYLLIYINSIDVLLN